MPLVTAIRKKHDVPKVTPTETKIHIEYSLQNIEAVHITQIHSVGIGIT